MEYKMIKNIIYTSMIFSLFSDVHATSLQVNPCLDKEETSMMKCLDEQYSSWDKKLNNHYKNIIKLLPKNEQPEFKKQQINWVKQKETECANQKTPKKIKVCELDMTQKQTTALQNVEEVIKPHTFEGIWKDCFSFKVDKNATQEDRLLQKRYGKEPICTTQYMYQKGKEIWGKWAYWASGHDEEGFFTAQMVDPETAKIIKKCGEAVPCYTASAKESKLVPANNWANSDSYIKICEGHLITGDSSLKAVKCPAALKNYKIGAKKQVMPVSRKMKLIKEFYQFN